MTSARQIASVTVAVLMAGVSAAALASEPAPPAPTVATAGQPTAQAPEKTAGDLASAGDIVVTARRTVESIQSVPVSATAFSAESLRQASIRDTQDLLIKTPGIFLAGSGGRLNSNFSIRGQSKALAGNSAPGVISYFNEVPQPTLGSSLPTYDLSSVQVLKGPQGTLFGRNTTGGAILYYSTAPTYQFSGYVDGTYGNFDTGLVEAALNVPLIDDHLAVRVAGQYQTRRGYTQNIGVGRNQDDLNSNAFRVSVLFEPVTGLRNTTIVDYYRSNAAGAASILTNVLPGPNALTATGTYAAAVAQLLLQQARGPRVTNADVAPFEYARRLGITNRTEADLGPAVQLVNILGLRRTMVDYFSSVDGLPTLISDGTGAIPRGLPVTVVNGRQTSNIEQFTDEVQLKGKFADGKLDWLVGGFYLKSRPIGPSGTYIPIFILPGITNAPFNYSFYTERSEAVFANVGYKLDGLIEGLRLNAGVRYTKDDISACVGGGTTPDPVITPEQCRSGAAGITNVSTNRTSSKAPTWTLGLDWQASHDVFLYVVTRRGYRAGGINSPTLAGRLTPFQSFAPETVTDVEAGIRSDFRAGDVGIRLNASPFIGWYSQVQVPIAGLTTQAGCSTTVPGGTDAPKSPDGDCNRNNDPSGGTLLVNAGKTQVSGADLLARLAFGRNIVLDAGATLLDLKSKSLTVPASLLPYLATAQVPFNLVAKTTLTAGVRFTLPVPASLGRTVLSFDFYHTSRVQVSDVFLPGYDLVNARLDFNDIGGSGFDASLFTRNLFDKQYLTSGNVSSAVLGATSAFYGTPRTFGLELRYHFGG